MQTKNGIIDDSIIVYADISIYSKDAILKCLYWYGDKFHTTVFLEEQSYKIVLTPLASQPISKGDLEPFQLKLERDLIDFNLRDIVTKETKNIRDLLIAKAFSNGEFDEQPPGEISDPVGFDVKDIK
jgi:His-Xaa-Ser system protein HxsD